MHACSVHWLTDSQKFPLGQLSVADLKVVRSTLWEARASWRDIGIELNLIVTDLDVIKGDCDGIIDKCFTEMLTQWLKQVDPPPTWSAVVTALKQPVIGKHRLAKQIENMHIFSGSNGTSADVAKLSFPHISEIVSDDSAREELEQRLRMESKDIILEFRVLRNKLFDSIEEQNFTTDKLVEYLDEDISTALQNQVIDAEPGSLKEVKQFIKRVSSFYDYQIIKYLIKTVGTDKDKDQLVEYEKAFCAYAKRRVYECPSIFHTSKVADTDSELHVKLDSVYDKIKVEELKELQYRLCTILKISVYACCLRSVQKGCVLLIFTIPSHFQETKFPLTEDQERALKELGVIQLTCGSYNYPRLNDQVMIEESTFHLL